MTTPPSPVYFTFADQSLGYDCAACGQRCCRGKTFAFASEELVPLLGKRPRLGRHLRLGAGGTLVAQNVTDRCWFLQSDGLCNVEVEHDRDSKPSTCRLFPFNRVYRVAVGDVRVIDFNSTLCPIEAHDGRGIAHAEIVKDLDQIGASPLVDSPKAPPEGLAADWWVVEEAAQRSYAAQATDADGAARALGLERAAAMAAEWGAVFELAPDRAAALVGPVASRVALLAGSLRFAQLFEHRPRPYATELRELPARLRALVLLGTLAADLLDEPPTLRALTELWHGQRTTLDVLAAWDRSVKITTPQFAADLPALLQPQLGQLLALGFRGGKTLGQIVSLVAETLPTGQRSLAVALAASQLPALFS